MKHSCMLYYVPFILSVACEFPVIFNYLVNSLHLRSVKSKEVSSFFKYNIRYFNDQIKKIVCTVSHNSAVFKLVSLCYESKQKHFFWPTLQGEVKI